jgi:hypothetical protein
MIPSTAYTSLCIARFTYLLGSPTKLTKENNYSGDESPIPSRVPLRVSVCVNSRGERTCGLAVLIEKAPVYASSIDSSAFAVVLLARMKRASYTE